LSESLLLGIRAELERMEDADRVARTQLALARNADAMGDHDLAWERYARLIGMRRNDVPNKVVTPTVLRDAVRAAYTIGIPDRALALLEEAYSQHLRSNAPLSELVQTAERALRIAEIFGSRETVESWHRRVDALRRLE
jgi:hypothetical protein